MFYLFSGVQHHLRRSDRPCTILTPADVFFVQNHTATQENTYTPCRPLEDHFPSTIRWCHPLMHDDFRDCCFHLPDHQIHPPDICDSGALQVRSPQAPRASARALRAWRRSCPAAAGGAEAGSAFGDCRIAGSAFRNTVVKRMFVSRAARWCCMMVA